MTDQTPNGEKKPALPTPAKKKTSAYDQPFNVMKDADQVKTSAHAEPVQRTNPQPSPASDWRSTSTSEPQKTAPAKEPAPKKAAADGSKKKKSASTTTQKAKNEIPATKGSAPAKNDKKSKAKDNQIDLEPPRSTRPGHKVLPYVFYAFAL